MISSSSMEDNFGLALFTPTPPSSLYELTKLCMGIVRTLRTDVERAWVERDTGCTLRNVWNARDDDEREALGPKSKKL